MIIYNNKISQEVNNKIYLVGINDNDNVDLAHWSFASLKIVIVVKIYIKIKII